MESFRLNIFKEKMMNVSQVYEEMKKDNSIDKLEELKKIIDDCNIFEKYNIEYLKLLKQIEKEEIFKNNLEKFECTLTEDKIIKNFYEFRKSKIESIDKIKIIMEELSTLNFQTDKEKELVIKNLFSQKKKEKQYNLNCQLLPLDNIELYSFNIYQLFLINIFDKINNFEIKNLSQYENEIDKNYAENKSHEIVGMIQQYDNSIEQVYKETIKSKINLEIENYEIFKIIHNNNFNDYLKGYSEFYSSLKNNLNKRFFKNKITEEKDIILFEQFSFFVSNYDFNNFREKYINLWKESLEELTIEEIKKIIEHENKYNRKKKSFKLINNNQDLEMKYKNQTFIIKDIKKFSIIELIDNLVNKDNLSSINNFDLINSLKIQYFSDFIHENILGNKWKNFLYQIFESKTIESLINSLHKDAYKIDRKEFKKIIDSVKFFNFNNYLFLGQSSPFYNIFISGILSLKENNNNKIDQIKYYTIILVVFLHEILGHILVLIIKVLYDKDIKSPETKGILYSSSSNKRGRESGEFMHVELFGRLLKSLTLKEICFIFNINNYSESNYKIFADNFSKCNEKTQVLEIPDILDDLLRDINLKDFSEISLNIYAYKGNDELTINILDGTTKICNVIDFTDNNIYFNDL